MEPPSLEPVEYRGQLVGLVSARRIHIVAPWLLERPAGDNELRLVVLMCMFRSRALRVDADLHADDAEAWALAQLQTS